MRVFAATVCTIALGLLAACGDDDGARSQSAATTTAEGSEGRSLVGAGADRRQYVGRSGTAKTTACELIARTRVERVVSRELGEPVSLNPRPNDSLDLSFCRYKKRHDPNLAVSVGLDTATRAVRRYYNMLTEARQLPNIFDPSKEGRPQLVFGVGNDRTYGGAGAYWVPLRAQLTSIRGDHIVKVHFYSPDVSDREAKRAAAQLARLAYEGYDRAAR